MSLDEAIQRLLAATPTLPERESLSTYAALGRVLGADVRSTIDVPPHDNSSMDGYALRAADVAAAGDWLPVSQRIAAGQVGAVLEPGTAARIFTGAPVPQGADVVVMQEQCEADTRDGRDGVRVHTAPQAGHFIRRRGEDVQAGAVVLAAGTRLTPQALGMAASVGAAALSVVRRPRVALFSTGDELVMPGEPLRPGAIYNSNRYLLRALLEKVGCDVTDLGIVPDQLQATRQALRRAAEGHDVILTTGGVSVGEEDHLKPAVQAEGSLDLWQIAMKPGKPLAFGQVRGRDKSALFLGLPGNPVSGFVTFLLVVRPVLLALQGVAYQAPRALTLPAATDGPAKPDARREFLRALRQDDGSVALFANQSSGVLTSAVWGDGLVDNPAGTVIRQGMPLRFLPFSDLLA
jgi:molybdopterin molybdotransferase